MQKIKYTFLDGLTQEVEVSDELYAVHAEIVQAEKRNHWRNTRRHVSLDYLNKHEIDIEAPDSDSLVMLIQKEDETNLHNAIALLSHKQRELVQKVFFDGMTMTEIAQAEGVDRTAISHRLATIYKKIKNLL